jgi:hypothetical protein
MTSDTSSKIIYFDNIPATPEKKSIMSRLGYRTRLTTLQPGDISSMGETINLGLALCRNRGALGRLTITDHSDDSISLPDGNCFEDKQLARLLRHSEEVLLMAGTTGSEITTSISREMEEGNASRAVILDAVASCSADMILDWLMETFNKMIRKEGRKLTRRRFSPGFSELSLNNQAVIFRLLGLERLNLHLTDSMMLVPEKSVLAIAGIERITN